MQHIACSKLSSRLNHFFRQVVLKNLFIHHIIVINSFVNAINFNIFTNMIRIRQATCLKKPAKTNCRSSFTYIPYMWIASQIQTMILCFIYQPFFKKLNFLYYLYWNSLGQLVNFLLVT